MGRGKVYVVHNEWIKDPETNEMPYKIGITKNLVEDRYYGLGLKMPGEFVCDFAYEFGETYSNVEKTLHNMLNQLNVNGEWFNVNEEALDGIRNICDLAGGKLITEKVEDEIFIETEDIKNKEWSGYYFVNTGDKSDNNLLGRNWSYNVQYCFVSSGGGSIWINAIKRLKKGNKIFAYISGKGYVGYGIVEEEAVLLRPR